MKIQNTLVWNIRGRSQPYFAHVTTVSLSWRVQKIVVIGRVYSKLERSEFSSNFEFDPNMLSGTVACTMPLSVSLGLRFSIFVNDSWLNRNRGRPSVYKEHGFYCGIVPLRAAIPNISTIWIVSWGCRIMAKIPRVQLTKTQWHYFKNYLPSVRWLVDIIFGFYDIWSESLV